MPDPATALDTFPVLETDRLTLREVTADDAGAMFAIMSDPRVMRYYGPPMRSPEEAVKRVEGIRAAFQARDGVYWALAERSSGELVGSGGLFRIATPHRRAELGYELAPSWWNRGLMTEAAAAMVGFGFESLGLHSLEAGIHPDNLGSRRVLEKLGFVREAYFRERYFDTGRNAFIDAEVFSLLHADWERSVATRR